MAFDANTDVSARVSCGVSVTNICPARLYLEKSRITKA
jgi:hypothetical protein